MHAADQLEMLIWSQTERYCHRQSYSCVNTFLMHAVVCATQHHTQILSQHHMLHEKTARAKSLYVQLQGYLCPVISLFNTATQN